MFNFIIKKRKFIIITFLVIILFILFLQFALGINLKDYYDRHIGRIPHVTGQVTLTINGSKYVLDNKSAELTYRNDTMNRAKKLSLKDGKFSRALGEYGDNLFNLKLSPQFCMENIDSSLKDGVNIEFGFLTGNNWHKNHTELNIFIDPNPGKNSAAVKIEEKVTGDDKGSASEEYLLDYKLENHGPYKVYISFI